MNKQKVENRFYDLKYVIFFTLTFFLLGTFVELYLINHYTDIFQIIPIVCVAISFFSFLVLIFKVTRLTLKLFKFTLLSNSLIGLLGVFFHLNSNYEFEKEMKPSSDSWGLFVESLSGALPALAPLNLVILSMVGYSYILILKQNQ